jgi:hypothetical protein
MITFCLRPSAARPWRYAPVAVEHVTVPVFPGLGPEPYKSGPDSVGAGAVKDRSRFAQSQSRFLVTGPAPGPNL